MELVHNAQKLTGLLGEVQHLAGAGVEPARGGVEVVLRSRIRASSSPDLEAFGSSHVELLAGLLQLPPGALPGPTGRRP